MRVTKMAIAVLSNINMNFVIRLLQKETEVYEAEGYGNELGILMNPGSTYHAFGADTTFLVMDLLELLEHDLESTTAGEKIDDWFGALESALKREHTYYISDAYLWGFEIDALHETGKKQELEQLWQSRLKECCKAHGNVHILPYRRMLEKLGENNAFSPKMWYMGKILLSSEAQKELSALILHKMTVQNRTPKKVLLLDLDNTLWGGLAGEADHSPIVLSEDHTGLAYKNLQRVILQMQKQGVLLAIVSKNNEEDAMKILREHPHMVLRPECFAAKKINWSPKHENILEIARELNLGTDSFVFWDDNPTERQLVQEMLPEVTVPDFPDSPEKLTTAMLAVYREYFEKNSVTNEDLAKTRQYQENEQRSHLQESVGSFEDYLKQLQIVVKRVNPSKHAERLLQLFNKTNQFNLTTKRYMAGELEEILANPHKKVFFYGVSDRFGDNGLVAAAILNLSDRIPVIEEFVMSCRVMGKNIEYAVIEDIEKEMQQAGYESLKGIYLPTAKNKPVAQLYEQLGYEEVKQLPEGGTEYRIQLAQAPKRSFYLADF